MTVTRISKAFARLAVLIAGLWFLSACAPTVENAVDLDTGKTASCLINDGGGVECWGSLSEASGALVVDFGPQSTPTGIAPLTSGAIDIAVGTNSACAIITNGENNAITCWGANEAGQLGDGSTESSAVPVMVIGLPDANPVQLTMYARHICTRFDTGAVACWGADNQDQLGNPGVGAFSPVPVQPSGLDGTVGKKVVDIGAGSLGTCAVIETGRVRCWGDDSEGMMGNGPGEADAATPELIAGSNNAVYIEVGHQTACAAEALPAADTYCWGSNADQNLGAGPALIETPIFFNPWSSAPTRISLGEERTCAVLATGVAECLGNAPLGDGTFTNSSTPVQVVDTDIDPMAVTNQNDDNICALGPDGDVRCWGLGATGNNGDGTYNNATTPVSVIR